jgi:hypothetical protein
MILSLSRFGIAPAEHVKMLEKRWTAHRKQNGLDLFGRVAASSEGLGCGHFGAPG